MLKRNHTKIFKIKTITIKFITNEWKKYKHNKDANTEKR